MKYYNTIHFILFSILISFAEMPYENYVRMQENSDNYLLITTIHSQIDTTWEKGYSRHFQERIIKVHHTAVVDTVFWSKDSLHCGDTISINYDCHTTMSVQKIRIDGKKRVIRRVAQIGPTPAPIFTSCKMRHAFLEESESSYAPSAMRLSFRPFDKAYNDSLKSEEFKKEINNESFNTCSSSTTLSRYVCCQKPFTEEETR